MFFSQMSRHGLVLTGGGARAAYQVGVLKAIAEITGFEKNPFPIITGYSAGAINGTWLASRCENFQDATQSMWNEWSKVTTDQVYRTDIYSFSKIAYRWLHDRSMGAVEKKAQISYLLDTTPLNHFLRTRIDFDALNTHLKANDLYAFSVSAANYHTGHSTAFFWGNEKIKTWEKLNRIAVRTEIQPEHVMASASLPVFFPPVRIGQSFYGDGMIRLNAPLSPPIHMGADRLLVIGIRGPCGTSEDLRPNSDTITLSEIAGTILNGLFFDSLDADIARMERINRTLSLMTEEQLSQQSDQLRVIPLLHLRPSIDVAELLTFELREVPRALRFLLKGIGLSNITGTDLLSYLLFEPKYIRALLELGFQDALKMKDQIEDFFELPLAQNQVPKTFHLKHSAPP